MSDLKFPPDVERQLHELCARAIKRAIENGTYKYLPLDDEEAEERETIE